MEQMARYSILINFYISIVTANKMKNRNASQQYQLVDIRVF